MRHVQNTSVSGLSGAASTLSKAASKMEGPELENNLRNLLNSSKGGIPLKRLDWEFYTFAGVHIPLGTFRDLEELLKTIPDVCTLKSNERGQPIVFGTKPRHQQTAVVLGGHSKPSTSGQPATGHGGGGGGAAGGGGGNKAARSSTQGPGGRGGRAPPHPQAPQNNRPHYAPRPRTGPSGRLPRRLPQSSRQQHQHHQRRRNRSNSTAGAAGSGGGGQQNNHYHTNYSNSNAGGVNANSGGHPKAGGGGGGGGRAPLSPGHQHHDANNNNNNSNNHQGASFPSRSRNMVWINPSIQYNGNGTAKSTTVYRGRPHAIPIVDPRSGRPVPARRGAGPPIGGGAGGGSTGGGAKGATTASSASSDQTALAMLTEFARSAGLPEPTFQLRESKPNKKATADQFLCIVELDGAKYKSYPDYKPTAELAKEAAAARALTALGINKENLQQRAAEKQASLPAADTSTSAQVDALAAKLAQMLEKRPNGVFCNSVPQLFAEEFKQKLPDDWQAKVSDHKLLEFVPNEVTKCDVLYRRESDSEPPATSAAPQVPPLLITDAQFMFVTTLIVDVNNFCGRVEREEYHSLVADMEAYYKVEANLVQQKLDANDRPVVGALYAVFDESWHRVQCMADETGGEAAEFRYVDLGISESIPRHKLMHLAYEFYTVPFLAVQLRLEEFDESNVSDSKRPSVHALMERLMRNKILWAVPAPGADLSARPLPVKVYDTGNDSAETASTGATTSEGGKDGTQIDVNTEVYKIVATPVIFPAPVIAKGYLSCVLPDGVIYLQIDDFGLSELRSLTVEPASGKHVDSVQANRVYCAQLEGNWYRCVATNIVSDEEIDIEFIDYGNKDTVDITKMFPLKTGSHVEDLPPQAVRAHMTDLQPVDMWTEEELSKITDFCPEDQMLIIKVSSSTTCQGRACDETIQHVDIFKRTQPNDELVSVNFKLSQEFKTSSRSSPLRQNGTAAAADTASPATASNGHTDAGGRLPACAHPPLAPVYPKSKPPTLGDTISLHVVSAASPLALVVQPFNTLSELANQRAQMQLYYGKQENRLAVSEFEISAGDFYACLQDEIWERAYIEKASGAPSPDGATCTMVVCYFVDNGAYMPLTVAATSIQPLHPQFRHLPRQAIQARLHRVEPRHKAADFDPMDCITFQKHITGRDLEGKICGLSEDSRIAPSPTFSLALELFDEELALREVYVEMELLAVVPDSTPGSAQP